MKFPTEILSAEEHKDKHTFSFFRWNLVITDFYWFPDRFSSLWLVLFLFWTILLWVVLQSTDISQASEMSILALTFAFTNGYCCSAYEEQETYYIFRVETSENHWVLLPLYSRLGLPQ